MNDDHESMYIYPYKASMIVPCPFETLKIDRSASKEEIDRAADAIGTEEANDARNKAHSIYYHPPCNKARRQRMVRETDKGTDEHKNSRKVIEKVIMIYKTEYFHIGLRDQPNFNEAQFIAIKNKWGLQLRYEAEEMFWNGFGDCKTKLHNAEQKIKELQAELTRVKSDSKQKILEARMELKSAQQDLKTSQTSRTTSLPEPMQIDEPRNAQLEREYDHVCEELETVEQKNAQNTERIGELETSVADLKEQLKRACAERDFAEKGRDAAEHRLESLESP